MDAKDFEEAQKKSSEELTALVAAVLRKKTNAYVFVGKTKMPVGKINGYLTSVKLEANRRVAVFDFVQQLRGLNKRLNPSHEGENVLAGQLALVSLVPDRRYKGGHRLQMRSA